MPHPRLSVADGQEQIQLNNLTTTRHQYALQDGEKVEICIQSFDPPRDPKLGSLPSITTESPSHPPWILGISGTVYIEPGDDDTKRTSAGKVGGLLIKRDLIPPGEDEFLRQMMNVNSYTQQQAQQLFDSQGRLRRKFRARGIWGSENDESWIFEIAMMEIAPDYRREGVGKKLVECVREEILTWAREAQREVLMVLMLGAPKSEVDKHKLIHPSTSAADLQQVSSTARLSAKRFWRSLGFRRLSARSTWFGWARSVADPGDHPFIVHGEWESEDETIKLDIHDGDIAPDVAEKLLAWDN